MSTIAHTQKENTFHKARSQLVDAFARLEARLALALHQGGKPIKGDTLAAKLKTLSTLPNQGGLSEEQFRRLADLVQFRDDLVHGPMAIVDLDGERFACFRNARRASDSVQQPSIVTYKTLKDMAKELEGFLAS